MFFSCVVNVCETKWLRVNSGNAVICTCLTVNSIRRLGSRCYWHHHLPRWSWPPRSSPLCQRHRFTLRCVLGRVLDFNVWKLKTLIFETRRRPVSTFLDTAPRTTASCFETSACSGSTPPCPATRLCAPAHCCFNAFRRARPTPFAMTRLWSFHNPLEENVAVMLASVFGSVSCTSFARSQRMLQLLLLPLCFKVVHSVSHTALPLLALDL